MQPSQPTSPSELRVDREAAVRDRFEHETAGHRMSVLRDDGLYRHLRFMGPGWAYGYDLITWPGHLAIAGDCGDYTFARLADMFEFFRADAGRINPHYWSEKLTNRDMRAGTRRFEPDLFRPRVMEWYEDLQEDSPDEGELLRALNEQVFWADGPYSRDDAISRLLDFEHEGLRIDDSYEWSFEEWDWQFLWCCWAITQGIAQYDWAKGWR